MKSAKNASLGFLFLIFVFTFPLSAETANDGDSGDIKPLGKESAVDKKTDPGGKTANNAKPFFSLETAVEEGLFTEDEDDADDGTLLSESAPEAEAPIEDDDYNYLLLFEANPFVIEASPVYEIRSFEQLFPDLSESQKAQVMSGRGLRHSMENNESPALIPAKNSGINIINTVMKKSPSHIIEALVIIPYRNRELEILDIYNALSRIENLKDQTYHVNGNDYNIFQDSTRLDGPASKKPINDPPPAQDLPYAETMYIRLTDSFMGELFVRGDLTMSLYGITYNMTNFTDIRYSIFRIMKAERYITVIYLEPVNEGVLIYSISGLYLPSFIARRVNLTSSINNRITALVNWITDGLRIQDRIIRQAPTTP